MAREMLPSSKTAEIDLISDSSFDTPPSTVPDSQPEASPVSHRPFTPTPSPTSSWEAKIKSSPNEELFQPLPSQELPFSISSNSSASVQEIEPLAKRFRVDADREETVKSTSARDSVSVAAVADADRTVPPQPSTINPTRSASSDSTVTSLPQLPLQILPPPPRPSETLKFTTHVTSALRDLMDIRDFRGLHRLYKPVAEIRPPSRQERGYWYLRIPVATTCRSRSDSNKETEAHGSSENPSSKQPTGGVWSVETFINFWSYLTTYISQEGLAGWGVWCFCDAAKPAGPAESADEEAPCKVENYITDLDVRIYTWGEIVPHIYLVIILASDKRATQLPVVEWRDGGEKVVINMV
ncbi:hypothetical protein FQN57_001211 [Myotisia sp. PD_48]|nr:hypothetical protein FQN57_001211 [Myotisia sp. PD_48]